MPDTEATFEVLRQAADPAVVSRIESLVATGPDRALNRINPLAFAARNGLGEEAVIGAFVRASRLGLFDLSWNVLCPGCGGVLDSNASLKTLDRSEYHCGLCAAGYEPTLDEMVEVTFTVSPRLRRIGAHDPDSLPLHEYARQVFWSSGVDLPEDDLEERFAEVTLDIVELPAQEKAILSVELPAAFIIVFDPVTHATQFIDVKGEPTRDKRQMSIVLNEVHAAKGTVEMQPGPLRLTFENRTSRRVLPGLWVANDMLHAMLGKRRPFLTAKRLLSNQAFRDLYRTDTLDVDQRLKITSLTFLFTDLKGSTALYDRVGDLVAFDLVRAHFQLLLEIVAAEAGAVVKTIGDAVMATFATPERAVAAALRMRREMRSLNEAHGREELLLNIGVHEGPCLAVMLNDRQDYFGQTVNVASRVQGLADARAILATAPVVDDLQVSRLLEAEGIAPVARPASLRGVSEVMTVYEIP
jgi:class 3 adenylate cyclase